MSRLQAALPPAVEIGQRIAVPAATWGNALPADASLQLGTIKQECLVNICRHFFWIGWDDGTADAKQHVDYVRCYSVDAESGLTPYSIGDQWAIECHERVLRGQMPTGRCVKIDSRATNNLI